jgi:hypothetical protein
VRQLRFSFDFVHQYAPALIIFRRGHYGFEYRQHRVLVHAHGLVLVLLDSQAYGSLINVLLQLVPRLKEEKNIALYISLVPFLYTSP